MLRSELYPKDAIVNALDAYKAVLQESSKQAPAEPKSHAKQIVLFTVVSLAIAMIIMAVLIIMTAPQEPQVLGVIIIVALCILVPIVGGVIAWFVEGLLFAAKRFNFQSARQVSDKLHLQFCGFVPITNDAIKGVLPRLHDNGTITPTAAVRLLYGGDVDGVQLYGVDCLQEISIVKGFKGAMRALTGVVAKPLNANVPDLLLLPNKDPQIKYFADEVSGGSQLGDYRLQFDRWGAFGDGWEGKLSLLKAIEQKIEKRADVCLQILSGIVVIYRHIGDHILIKKLTPEAIEADISLATDIAKLIAAE